MPEKMQTKRDYLIAKGLAKPGHGRFSNAAKEEITKAINKGIRFGEPGEEKTAGIGATRPPRRDRPEGRYVFRNVSNGLVWDTLHTAVCAKCPYSFRWCTCLDGPWQRERDGERVQHQHPYGTCNCPDKWGAFAVLQSMPNGRNVQQATTRRAPRKRAPKPKG